MSTQALGTFGVYGRPGDDELDVLDTANEFRRELCAVYQARHEAMIDWRNNTWPALFAAMVEYERLYHVIAEIEREIKEFHSAIRDRNARTKEQTARLRDARIDRNRQKEIIVRLKQEWLDAQKAFTAWWQAQRDWKNVKSLEKRRQYYAEIALPTVAAPYAEALAAKAAAKGKPPLACTASAEAIRSYGALWIEYDLKERSVYERFSPLLHSSIRAEIVEASQPKLGKTGPGMRYRYGRKLDIRPWQKLSLQITGGLTIADLLDGKSRALQLTLCDRNKRGESWYTVRHQIGTSATPRVIEYTMRAHRPLPSDAVVKWWSLAIREGGKREVIPLLDTDHSKPIGSGLFGYRLLWEPCDEGVAVCRFWGAHVNETLVVPHHILHLKAATKRTQAECDAEANQWLARYGEPVEGKRQGYQALLTYAEAHPMDNAAANLLHTLTVRIKRALRVSRRAASCLEKIYETAAYRVCSRHSAVASHNIDLAKMKRYKTRDLLRSDAKPQEQRELITALAPGKLKALIDKYGLASSEVEPPSPGAARKTDLLSTYVRSIGGRERRKQTGKKRRSQSASQ